MADKKRLYLIGGIAGGALVLGMTFTAGAVAGHFIDGPRDAAFGAPVGAGHGGPVGPDGARPGFPGDDDRAGAPGDENAPGSQGDGDNDSGSTPGGQFQSPAPQNTTP